MLKEKKGQIIDSLVDKLSRSTIAIATDYRGLSAREMDSLRQRLREAGVEYRVIKNTLARFAGERAGGRQIETFLDGPVAIAFGYDDAVKAARALTEYIRSAGSILNIKGGLLGDRVLTSEQVLTLSTLSSREVLISQLMGQLQAPVQSLHNLLSGLLQQLLNVLQARIQQFEGGENA